MLLTAHGVRQAFVWASSINSISKPYIDRIDLCIHYRTYTNNMVVEIIKFDTRPSFDAGTLRVSYGKNVIVI